MTAKISFDTSALESADKKIKDVAEAMADAKKSVDAAKNNANWKCREKSGIDDKLAEAHAAMTNLTNRIKAFSDACNYTVTALKNAESEFDKTSKALDKQYKDSKGSFTSFTNSFVSKRQNAIRNLWAKLARSTVTTAGIGVSPFDGMAIAGNAKNLERSDGFQ